MNYTAFACGSIGGGLGLLILAVLASWAISGVLFLVNLCLLFELRDGALLRHAAGLFLYAAAAVAAYKWLARASVPNLDFLLFSCALGAPAIVIGHCIWLVRLVRRERRSLRSAVQTP